MKQRFTLTLSFGILTACWVLLSAFGSPRTGPPKAHAALPRSDADLRRAALEILDTKCNVCHRKKNPFMIFNNKNMTKRAPRIYRMVFVERRMPKGNEIRLTNEEASTLQKWVFTQEIF